MDTTAAALVDPYLQDVRDAHFDLGDKLGILVSAVVLSTSVNRMIEKLPFHTYWKIVLT